MEEREEPLHEGHGAHGTLVTHGAATLAGNAALCNARPQAPERQAALPLSAPRRKPPNPEQIAKVVTAKCLSPTGLLADILGDAAK